MDLIATPADGAKTWELADLLGRSVGAVEERGPADFMIRPAGPTLSAMPQNTRGPYPSLDAALAEIEKHTRGVCRRSPE